MTLNRVGDIALAPGAICHFFAVNPSVIKLLFACVTDFVVAVQAGNSGDTALERRTESEWRQARIQAEVLSQAHRRLRKARASGDAGDADRVQLSITKLQLESLSMNALFNDFALVRLRRCTVSACRERACCVQSSLLLLL